MKRPWAVTVLGLLFMVAGLVGLFYHVTTEKFGWGLILVLLLRVLAVVGGIFLLLGRSWARWLTVGWLAIHVVVSAFDSLDCISCRKSSRSSRSPSSNGL